MTDTKRIQELINRIQIRGLLESDTRDIVEALSDLASIKGAALSVPEIEERVDAFSEEVVNASIVMGTSALVNLSRVAASDRATLLDALRAVTAERAAKHENRESRECFEKAANIFKAERDEQSELRRQAEEALRAKEADCSDLLRRPAESRALRAEAERDNLRAELARMTTVAEERADLNQRLSEETGKQLAQAERDKAAMRAECDFLLKTRTELALKVPILEDGIRLYREFGRMGYSLRGPHVKEWERDHGALVPPAIHVDCTPDELRAMLDDKPRNGETEKGQESKAECTCEPGPVTFASVCDPCKDALPAGLWLKFTASELPQRKEAALEIERILAAHRDTKPDDMPSVDALDEAFMSGGGGGGGAFRHSKGCPGREPGQECADSCRLRTMGKSEQPEGT